MRPLARLICSLPAALLLACGGEDGMTCGSGTRLEGSMCLPASSPSAGKSGQGGAGKAGNGASGASASAGAASAGTGGQGGAGQAGSAAGGAGQGGAGQAGAGQAGQAAGQGGAGQGVVGAGGAGASGAGVGGVGVGGAGVGGPGAGGAGTSGQSGEGGQGAGSGGGPGGGPGCAGGCQPGEACDAGVCRVYCGVSDAQGSEDFVLRATQWRMATFLYLRHFGQDNTGSVMQQMEWAKAQGFNAVTVPVGWDEIEIEAGDIASGAHWMLVEKVLNKAQSLGLKVRVNIWLNRFFKAPSEADPQTPFYGASDCSRGEDGSTEGDLSFHSPRVGNAMAFVRRAVERTRPWLESGVVGWYSVVHNTTAELGYAHGASAPDYSAAALSAFRAWLEDASQNPAPYKSIQELNAAWGTSYGGFDEAQPLSMGGYSSQNVFAGRRGEDWWRFREHGIRKFIGQLRQTLDQTVDGSWTRPVRVINDYGSVYDRLGPTRQSYDFPSHFQLLGPHGFGVKQNADNLKPVDEQRFSMDLLTSQARKLGAASFNEAFRQGLSTPQWADVIQAWLDAGANGYSVYSNFADPAIRQEIEALAGELSQRGYWGGPVRCPQYQGQVSYSASGLLRFFWDGGQDGGPSYLDQFKAASQGKNAQFSFQNDLWP